MRWPVHRYAAFALTAAFLVAGGLRLGPFLALNPDSSEYLVRARSLAALEGDRDVSRPDRTAQLLRPPGVSLLMVPAAWISPYGVVAAKITLLVVVVPFVYVYLRFSALAAGEGGALAALALVLTSPFFLFYALDDFSQVPYLAVMIAAILVLDGAKPTDGRRWLVAGLLVGLAPLIRAIGLALVLPAVLLIVLGRPRRWRLAGASLAVMPSLLWVIRDELAGESVSYHGLAERVQALPGLSNIFSTAISNVPYYISELAALAFPTVWPAPDLMITCAGGPEPRLPGPAALVLGSAFFLLAAAGLWTERGRLRWLLVGYGVCYLGVLAAYPFKSERLLYGLAVLLLPYQIRAARRLLALAGSALGLGVSSPASATDDAARVPAAQGPIVHSRSLRQVIPGLTAWLMVAAMVVPQAALAARLAWTGAQFLAGPEGFYAKYENNLPSYYADWPSAGRYLAEHSPAYARVLTERHGLFLWSRRLQHHAHLSRYSAAMLSGHVGELKPQYLAVVEPTGDLPSRLALPTPQYRFERVYGRRGVGVYRIEPNREGTILTAGSYRTAIERLRERMQDDPDATVLRSRLIELLEADGQYAVVAELAEQRIDRGLGSVDDYLALANALMELGRYDESRRWWTAAAHLPGADQTAEGIRAGLAVLRQFEIRDGKSAAVEDRVGAGLMIVRGHLTVNRLEAALEASRKVLEIERQHPEGLYWQGAVLELLGRKAEARASFRGAAGQHHGGAQRKLLIAQWEEALVGASPVAIRYAARSDSGSGPTTRGPGRTVERVRRVDPKQVGDHVALAQLLGEDGFPGRALAVLVRAAERFADSPVAHQSLAAAYEFFGQWAEADAACRRALELSPDDATIRAQARRIREALAPPHIP